VAVEVLLRKVELLVLVVQEEAVTAALFKEMEVQELH
jgi:hypothetical protein